MALLLAFLQQTGSMARPLRIDGEGRHTTSPAVGTIAIRSSSRMRIERHSLHCWETRIHQAMHIHEYTLKELSEHLGLHYSTISVIAKQVGQALRSQE